MNDWHIKCLKHICGVFRRSRIYRASSVSDLIVSYYVNASIYVEIRSLGQTLSLENNALTTDCSVAVHLNIKN